MDFIQRNVFIKLRAENFHTSEELEPMTNYKKEKLKQYVKNIDSLPAGLVVLANPLLNKRLKEIQINERNSMDTSVETIYLLRIIVANVNASLNGGMTMRGIIQLGQYLRTRGNKVNFDKLQTWLTDLHIERMAQLQGSILIDLFQFAAEEIPFVRHRERKAEKMALRSLSYNYHDAQENIKLSQDKAGFVKVNAKQVRRNLRRSMRYFDYAPLETISNFLHNLSRSLSEIEE